MPSTMKLEVVSTGCCLAKIHIILLYFTACLPVDMVMRLIVFFPTVSHSFLMDMKPEYFFSASSPSMK